MATKFWSLKYQYFSAARERWNSHHLSQKYKDIIFPKTTKKMKNEKICFRNFI